jgi:hypothetical protein
MSICPHCYDGDHKATLLRGVQTLHDLVRHSIDDTTPDTALVNEAHQIIIDGFGLCFRSPLCRHGPDYIAKQKEVFDLLCTQLLTFLYQDE